MPIDSARADRFASPKTRGDGDRKIERVAHVRSKHLEACKISLMELTAIRRGRDSLYFNIDLPAVLRVHHSLTTEDPPAMNYIPSSTRGFR
jgi:hypothetical protein